MGAIHNNPYIGLRTYEEPDAVFFRGREAASTELFRMIEDNDVVVLHAESGEGKSSVLNAGLVPILREERYLPIKINFTEEDFELENPDFDQIVFSRIKNEVNQINDSINSDFSAGIFNSAESASRRLSFVAIASENSVDEKFSYLRTNIWWLLRNYAPSAYGAVLMPVLIFDQFEEIFTRPNSIAWTESFFIWLTNTIGDAIPQELRHKIRETIGLEADFPKLPTSKKFKALFSLRTEFIGELDYWAVQRHKIYALKNSRYCLKPLTEKEANEVLELQPAFDDNIKQQIKKSICLSKLIGKSASNLPNFPAMLLSIVCSTASENLDSALGLDNTPSVAGAARNNDFFDNIIFQFYKKEVEAAKIPQKDLEHIESVLVDDKGKRVRIKSDNKELRKIQFEEKYKKILEDRRLIKSSQISGGVYVELTHDALAKVIIQQRAKKTDKKEWTIQMVLYGIGILLMGLGIRYWNSTLVFGNKFIGMGEYHFLTQIGYSPSHLYLLKELVFASIYALVGAAVFYLSKNKNIEIVKTLQLLGFYIISLVPLLILPILHSTFVIVYILAILIYAIIGIYVFYLSKNRPTDFIKKIQLLYNTVLVLLPFLVAFIWRQNDLIANSRGLKCSPILVVLGIDILCFYFGNIIFRRNNWIKYVGYLLIIWAFMPIVSSIKLLISLALFIISLFYWGAYIFTREKNIVKILPIAIITMFVIAGICYLYNSSSNNPFIYLEYAKYLIYILFALTIWGTFQPKTRSFSDAIKYIFTGQLHKEYPFIPKALYVFLICIACCLVIKAGQSFYINIKILLIALPIISIICYLLYNRVVLIGKTVKHNIVIAGIVAFSIAMVGLSQFVLYHGYIVIVIWCFSGGLLYLFNSEVTEPGNKKIGLLKISVLWLLLIVIMPFAGYGFNLLNDNNTRLASLNKIPTFYTKLLDIKNRENLVGLRDRYGNVVVPCEYDSIIYRCERSPYFYAPRADIFVLKKGNLYTLWVSYEHLNEVNELTDNLYNYVKAIGFASTNSLKYIIPAMKVRNENAELYNKTAELYTNSMVSRLVLNDNNTIDFISFNDKGLKYDIAFDINKVDSLFIKKIRQIRYDAIDLSMLPYASNSYIDKFIDNVYSNYYVIPSVSVRDAISPFFDIEKYKEISDEANITDYALYSLGDLYSYLVSLYVETGEYDKAEKYMVKALDLPYTEPVKVDYYVMKLLNGDSFYLEDICDEQQKLIKVTPNPSISDEWERLEYNTLYELIEKRLEYLYNNQLGDKKKIKKAKELLASIERAPQPSIPYNYIQVIPDSLGGGLRYRGSISDVTDINDREFTHIFAERFYDYFVKDGEVVCPPIFWYTPPEDNPESPTLVIELLSKKRRYIKDGQNVLFKPSGIPEFLPGEYDHAWAFSEGMAAVEVNGKIGFINEAGEMVIEPQFTSSFPTSSHSFIRVDYNIYKNKVGKDRYLKSPYFENGLCPVYIGDELIMIDKTGNRVALPPDSAFAEEDAEAIVETALQ